MELVFAGLHQLLAPMLDRIEGLPAPQRDALATVSGVSAGSAPDHFLVGLAVLGLLSDVAEDRPLICLVDDESGSIAPPCRFSRSLRAAWRPNRSGWCSRPAKRVMMAGLPELVVVGLDEGDAGSLLESVHRVGEREPARELRR